MSIYWPVQKNIREARRPQPCSSVHAIPFLQCSMVYPRTLVSTERPHTRTGTSPVVQETMETINMRTAPLLLHPKTHYCRNLEPPTHQLQLFPVTWQNTPRKYQYISSPPADTIHKPYSTTNQLLLASKIMVAPCQLPPDLCYARRTAVAEQ